MKIRIDYIDHPEVDETQGILETKGINDNTYYGKWINENKILNKKIIKVEHDTLGSLVLTLDD